MAAVVKKSKKNVKYNYIKPVKLSKLTAPQRRVAIAKDVIAGLKAKRLLATHNIYCAVGNEHGNTHTKNLPDTGKVELADVLAAVPKCEVCAKGAMFIAAVEKFDQLKVDIEEVVPGYFDNKDNRIIDLDSINDDISMSDHLSKYFSQQQLDLIERAFEGSSDYEGSSYYEDFPASDSTDEEKAVALIDTAKYPDATDRMIAIMENLIKNNGKFICKINL